jgi:hypothetical protein
MPEPEYTSNQCVNQHLYLLRKRLERRGETIVNEWRRDRIMYRHVRLIAKE